MRSLVAIECAATGEYYRWFTSFLLPISLTCQLSTLPCMCHHEYFNIIRIFYPVVRLSDWKSRLCLMVLYHTWRPPICSHDTLATFFVQSPQGRCACSSFVAFPWLMKAWLSRFRAQTNCLAGTIFMPQEPRSSEMSCYCYCSCSRAFAIHLGRWTSDFFSIQTLLRGSTQSGYGFYRHT